LETVVTARRSITLLALLSLLIALPALAAKKEPKPLKQLQPLVDETALVGPVSKDAFKALRYADRCLTSDKNWERAQQNQVPINQFYEMLSSAVVCWQTAEKKLGKVGESVVTAGLWVSARARYMEAFRAYVWGVDAKQSGKRNQVCRRLKEATTLAVAANEASSGIVDKFTDANAKGLAMAADQLSEQLGAQIATEFSNQKCD